MLFFPSSSVHFLEALVKAFLLDLYLEFQKDWDSSDKSERSANAVLVESSSAFLTKMLGPYRCELSESTRSLHVSNNTNNNKWGRLQDGNSFHNFFLMIFGTNSVNFSNYVCHTSFKCNEPSNVAWLTRIIFRERFDFTILPFTAFSWQKPK